MFGYILYSFEFFDIIELDAAHPYIVIMIIIIIIVIIIIIIIIILSSSDNHVICSNNHSKLSFLKKKNCINS
jgi:uncharacterized membrane protein